VPLTRKTLLDCVCVCCTTGSTSAGPLPSSDDASLSGRMSMATYVAAVLASARHDGSIGISPSKPERSLAGGKRGREHSSARRRARADSNDDAAAAAGGGGSGEQQHRHPEHSCSPAKARRTKRRHSAAAAARASASNTAAAAAATAAGIGSTAAASGGGAGSAAQPLVGAAANGGQSPPSGLQHRAVEALDHSGPNCEYDACKLSPSFGYHGDPPSLCAVHRKPGMIDRCVSVQCSLLDVHAAAAIVLILVVVH
jgi:hypothetical protein